MFRSSEGLEAEDNEKSSGPSQGSPCTGEDSVKTKVCFLYLLLRNLYQVFSEVYCTYLVKEFAYDNK